jgi:glycopeptide antibiotics resistance protein
MKAALYVLGGIVAMFAFGGVVILGIEILEWLFGPVWGVGIFGLVLMALSGGYTGWMIYRLRASQRRD